MHELSIAEGLVDAVKRECLAYPGARIRAVTVRIGALRQVEPSSLHLAYDALIKDTPLAETRLEIEPVPARARCRQCRTEFDVTEEWFLCPACDAGGADLVTGRELDLVRLELYETKET
jgi:hydrogenase nickel incorporation protein HypA/HybF